MPPAGKRDLRQLIVLEDRHAVRLQLGHDDRQLAAADTGLSGFLALPVGRDDLNALRHDVGRQVDGHRSPMLGPPLFGLAIDDVENQGRRRGASPQGQAEAGLAGLQGLEAQQFRVEVKVLVFVVELALPSDFRERPVLAGVVAGRTVHGEGEEPAGRVDFRSADANPKPAILGRDFHPGEAAEAPVVEQHDRHLLARHTPAGGHR